MSVDSPLKLLMSFKIFGLKSSKGVTLACINSQGFSGSRGFGGELNYGNTHNWGMADGSG